MAANKEDYDGNKHNRRGVAKGKMVCFEMPGIRLYFSGQNQRCGYERNDGNILSLPEMIGFEKYPLKVA